MGYAVDSDSHPVLPRSRLDHYKQASEVYNFDGWHTAVSASGSVSPAATRVVNGEHNADKCKRSKDFDGCHIAVSGSRSASPTA